MTTITVPKQTWDALINALENHPGNYKLTKSESAAMSKVLTAANAVSVEPQVQEPVAWMWTVSRDSAIQKRKGSKVGVYFEHPASIGISMAGKDYVWTPLYANPQATEPTERRKLYECTGCGHLYDERPSVCDCMENPGRTYNDWVATPAAPEAQ